MSFFDASDCVLNSLTKHVAVFLEECQATTSNLLPLSRVNTSDEELFTNLVKHMQEGNNYGWFQGWGNSNLPNPDWTQYGLTVYDNQISWAACPKSQELLSQFKRIKSAAFIRMNPYTILPFHTHPEVQEEGNLQAHLTLEAEPGAYLVVDGEIRPHKVGELLVFDGSRPHTAFNGSSKVRTILYIEFHRTCFMQPFV